MKGIRKHAILAVGTLVAVHAASLSASGQALSAGAQSAVAQAAAAQPADAGPTVRQLSVDEVLELALENNLDIQVERINPQIQDLAIVQTRANWTPNLTTDFSNNSSSTPPNSFLSGSQTTLESNTLGASFGVEQEVPWGGGAYSVAWNSSRNTTNNEFSNFDPTLRSNLNVSFFQPILRNFRIDNTRQQLLITQNNREISDVDLQGTIAATSRNVENAYWDLVFARSNLAVQQQSLELAEQTLRDNRTRVEVGTMAPIDIVEAQAEVARNEEAVIVAQALIQDAEDQLRALIFDPSQPDFWNVQIEPTDTPNIEPMVVNIDSAVGTALANRTDLTRERRSLDNTDVNIRYFRNQTLPQLDLGVILNAQGLGGTQLIRGEGFPGPIIGANQRSYADVLQDLAGFDFPTWTVQLAISYPIGTSPADASLARARLQRTQSARNIDNLELQVATEVRQIGRQVRTNLQRVDATRAARELAEQRLDAEQKKFAVGLSTSFQVFQAQRDLAQARNNELRSQLDYAKSRVDFEAVQRAPLSGGGASGAGGNAFTAQPNTGATFGTQGFNTGAGGGGGGGGQP